MRLLMLLAALAAFAHAAAGQDDPIHVKHEKAIAKARAACQEELDKLDAAMGKYFDAAEAAARKKGDKKAIDALARERTACDLLGVIPKGAPPAHGQKLTAAADKLAAAYTAAVKEYTKAGKDDLAGDVQKRADALAALRKDGAAPRYLLIVNRKTGLNVTTEKEDAARGSPLVQAETSGKPNQHWQFVPTGDPTIFHVRNRASGHFFNVGGTATDGAQLILWDAGGGTNNNFAVARSGGFYTLMSTDTKKFASGDPAADGGAVRQKEKPTAEEPQQWVLVPVVP